jgi:hypothetical protein
MDMYPVMIGSRLLDLSILCSMYNHIKSEKWSEKGTEKGSKLQIQQIQLFAHPCQQPPKLLVSLQFGVQPRSCL